MRSLARPPGRKSLFRRKNERTRIGETDVRGKFARDLIAKPNSAIEIGQSRPNAAGGIGFVVEIHFDLRLKDETLRDVKVVRALQSTSDVPSIAKVESRFDIEKIGGEALNANRAPGSCGSGIQIGANARLPAVNLI